MSWDRVLTLLRQPPRISRKDLLLLILPALAWAGAFTLRRDVIELKCAQTPALCQPESVFSADRAAILLQSPSADRWSFVTQNTSGYLAFAIPVLWLILQLVRRRTTLAAGAKAWLADWTLLAQASVWNGLLTECARLLVQRPRPFVYSDPVRLGADAANYTSFVSGHTSFSATAATSLVLILVGRGVPARWIGFVAAIMASLVFLTGLFRILAGRHFLTDVLAATLVGTTVAIAVAWTHRDGWRRSC